MGKLKITSSYGIVPNAILNNKELSLRAKGVFAFLQGKPDGWNFSIVLNFSTDTRWKTLCKRIIKGARSQWIPTKIAY